MEFDILRHRTWNESPLNSDSPGPARGSASSEGDTYVTPGEFAMRRQPTASRAESARFVPTFFKNDVTRQWPSADSPSSVAPPERDTDTLSLIAIKACHVIRSTGGAQGIDILLRFSTGEWAVVLKDSDNVQALVSALASALSHDEAAKRLAELLLTDAPAPGPLFQSVIAIAFLNFQTVGTLADVVFARLNALLTPVSERLYSHAALIESSLDAFGAIANASPETSPACRKAFAWCRDFYAGFGTFVDPSATPEERARQKDDDRRLILKAQSALSALSPEKARRIFFEQAFSPLDPSFDPRLEKKFAHNAYYRSIGAAEQMAVLSGQRKLAFDRRLDEENNEWGRVAEKAVRENEIFRLEFFKEAHAASDPEALKRVRETLSTFDPHGYLMRNLVFAHVLRRLYVRRGIFDPTFVPDETFNAEYVASFDFAEAIHYRIPTSVYETDAKGFDAWVIALKRGNPDFFARLKAAVSALPEGERELPIDTLFMEVNEVEFFQYEIDPDKGPTAILDFVGPIRSWTSGYHGRVLTRVRAFMDQDRIRRDKAARPDSYKRPEDYYPDFAPAMCRERFELTILPILKAGENGSTLPELRFPASEAMLLLSYFDATGFSAYLPQWITFVIEHRFVNEDGGENLAPLRKAFDLLAATRFPRDLMRGLFERRGYLEDDAASPKKGARQAAVREAALACLKKLPDGEAIRPAYENGGTEPIRKKIRRAGAADIRILPTSYQDLKSEFTAETVGPREYFDYRRQARDLLKTHKIDAIRAILEEAISDKSLEYPANAPLSPLFPGLIGRFVTNARLEKALYDIATSGSSSNKGLASIIDFSTIMIRWAKRNRVDLTKVFTEAFADYRVPERVRELQDLVVETRGLIAEADRRIASLKTRRSLSAAFSSLPDDGTTEGSLEGWEARKKILEKDLKRREKERDAAIVALSKDPSHMSEQALFQLITSIYNAIRRQYLKEALIAGGESTARLVETHLEGTLIPEKRRLLASGPDGVSALREIEKRIEFLTDVLAQMETTGRD